MSAEFFKAVLHRRTRYQITKKSPIPNSKIVDIVQTSIKHVPSSFNSQSSRTVILFGQHHDKFWDQTATILKSMVPAEAFPTTKQKIDGFKAGHGTVLFFEDKLSVEDLQHKFPTYYDKFPDWSHHTNAMNQFVIWTALEAEGLGASLQHYNPLVDSWVKEEFNVPQEWSLIAQMPFGTPEGDLPEKTFKPIEERVKVFE